MESFSQMQCSASEKTGSSRLRLSVELRRCRLIVRRHSLGDEREVVGLGYQHLASETQLIRVTVGVEWNAVQVFRGCDFEEAHRQSSGALAEARNRGLQHGHIFINSDGAQVFQGILPNVGFMAQFISSGP